MSQCLIWNLCLRLLSSYFMLKIFVLQIIRIKYHNLRRCRVSIVCTSDESLTGSSQKLLFLTLSLSVLLTILLKYFISNFTIFVLCLSSAMSGFNAFTVVDKNIDSCFRVQFISLYQYTVEYTIIYDIQICLFVFLIFHSYLHLSKKEQTVETSQSISP